MNIIYAEDEELYREMITLELEGKIDCDIHEARNAKEAIDLIHNIKNVKIVISDYDMSGGNGGDLYQYIRAHFPNIPFILVSANEIEEKKEFKTFLKDHPLNFFLLKPFDPDLLIEKIKHILATFNSLTTTLPEFCRVRLIRFLRFNNVSSDIYLRLSQDKYVKIINQDELYDSDIIEKYSNKQVRYLYIRKDQFLRFSQDYMLILKNSLNKTNSNDEQTVDAQLSSVAFIHELVGNIGINSAVIEIIDDTLKSGINIIKKDDRLSMLINQMIKKQNFIYEHSLLTSYICGAMAVKMSWHTESTLQKLTIAALLHDVSLDQYNDEFTDDQIMALDNLRDSNLSSREKKIIRDHPANAAEMFTNNDLIPPNVDWIVKSHHEKPDGSGFPNGLDARTISPLACLFIIAETFARKVYAQGTSPNKLITIVNEIKQEFDKGNFKKPLEGLIKIMEDFVR